MTIGDIWKRLNEGWLGIVFPIVLGIILIVVFYFFIIQFVLHTSLPVVIVASSSMEHKNPELTHYGWLEKNLKYNRSFIDSWSIPNGFSIGDITIIQGSENYSVGDVIVYSAEGQSAPIIHRIVKINDDGSFTTKGDNNLSQHPYEHAVRKNQIYGKIILVISKIGNVKLSIDKAFGSNS